MKTIHMNKKTILFIACLLATVFMKAQTDSVTVYYAGYTCECCSGNTIPYICFNDPGVPLASGCPSSGSGSCGTSASCNTQSFMNTVPAGNVVTQVNVYYYTMNCGGSATPTLNGMPLSNAPVLNGSCLCSTLSSGWSVNASSSNTYPCGIPGYNYGVGATETFNVCFTGGNVCISKAEIVLSYTNAPTGTTPVVSILAPNDSICSGTTTTLTASGADTYTWSTGATANYITVSPANTTTYTVIGTDTTGACINMATKVIYVESINIQATQNFICGGPTSVTLTASGANTYTWNTGATTNTISATPTVTTTYTVNATGSMVGCTSLSAITTITVSPSPTPITSFTLTQDTAPHYWDAYAGYPANVTNASWSWGDGTSTIGLYPSHIYATPGSYYICVTVTVTTGCSATYCQSDSVYRLANNSVYSTMVYVNVLQPHSQTTGIKQVTSKENNLLTVYPNPANGTLTVECKFKNAELFICDVLGNKIMHLYAEKEITSIDINSLNKGVYFLNVKSANGISTKKFIVQR